MECWSSPQVYYTNYMIPYHTRMTLPYKMYGTIVYSGAQHENYIYPPSLCTASSSSKLNKINI